MSVLFCFFVVFFKQKTAYEMRISDWSSDVCASDLFPDVESCGTSTAVSVPCLFSPYGRHDYDEEKIRSHQSLLHVLQHAGVQVLWRDNQSGCKRVYDGLAFESVADATDPALCDGQRCFDEILLSGLDRKGDV